MTLGIDIANERGQGSDAVLTPYASIASAGKVVLVASRSCMMMGW